MLRLYFIRSFSVPRIHCLDLTTRSLFVAVISVSFHLTMSRGVTHQVFARYIDFFYMCYLISHIWQFQRLEDTSESVSEASVISCE